jgi:TatD DNase family protein
MSEYIDIGVNLTNKSLLQDVDGVLLRAMEHRVTRLVVTGTSIEESQKAIELCQRFPQQLICTAGVHPHHASDWQHDSETTLQTLAANDCVRAIGETGLDFNRNYSPADSQIEVFHRQLELARSIQKPLFTHQRDAHDTFIDIIRGYRADLKQIVVHCFTDNKAALGDYLNLDCHIGITGWICDERRGTELQELAKYIPADRLMVETDAPYLLPRTLCPRPKSRINEPSYLPHIVDIIAQHRGEPTEQFAAACLATTMAFFSI